MKSSNTVCVPDGVRCGLVSRDMDSLRPMDQEERAHLKYSEVCKFDARKFDKSVNEVIADIHARLSSGFWLKGTDAFRLFSLTLALSLQVLFM